MKTAAFNGSVNWILCLAAATGFFIVITGLLLFKTMTYQEQNRKLIILNDSIMSVNIEMKNALRFTGQTQTTFHRPFVRSKPAQKK